MTKGRAFSAQDYPLVDSSRLHLARSAWSLAEIEAGKLPVDLSITDADLLVAASIQTEEQGKLWGSDFVSVRALLTARVVRADTAKIILSQEADGTGQSTSRAVAAKKAAAQALERLAEKILEALGSRREELWIGKVRWKRWLHLRASDSLHRDPFRG